MYIYICLLWFHILYCLIFFFLFSVSVKYSSFGRNYAWLNKAIFTDYREYNENVSFQSTWRNFAECIFTGNRYPVSVHLFKEAVWIERWNIFLLLRTNFHQLYSNLADLPPKKFIFMYNVNHIRSMPFSSCSMLYMWYNVHCWAEPWINSVFIYKCCVLL